MRALFIPVVLVVAMVWSSTAQAVEDTEPAKVEDLIRRGIELRRSDHDNRALPLFQEAYERAPSPRTAAQLGLVEMALGYKLEAERHLAEAVGSRRDLWVNKNRAVLEGSLTTVRAAIGEVGIQGPTGADVTVSGKTVGRLPLSAPLRLGEGPATEQTSDPPSGVREVSRRCGPSRRLSIHGALFAPNFQI